MKSVSVFRLIPGESDKFVDEFKLDESGHVVSTNDSKLAKSLLEHGVFLKNGKTVKPEEGESFLQGIVESCARATYLGTRVE